MEKFSYFVGQFLIFLTQTTGNLGNAIIAFAVVLRLAMLPLVVSSHKSMDKMRRLQPKLNALKEQYKNDAAGLQKAQSALMKAENVNPIAGCVPQIVQLVVVIMLYQVLIHVFQDGGVNGATFTTEYGWFDLRHPDPTYAIPIIAGLTQFVLSFMMVPKGLLEKKPSTEKKGDFSQMGEDMQKQMVFMLPIMTALSLVFLKLPSGLGVYWIATTVATIVQQYFLGGLGAAQKYVKHIPVVGDFLIKFQGSKGEVSGGITEQVIEIREEVAEVQEDVSDFAKAFMSSQNKKSSTAATASKKAKKKNTKKGKK